MRWLPCVLLVCACGSPPEPAPEVTESPAVPAPEPIEPIEFVESPVVAAPDEGFAVTSVALGPMALLAERCGLSGPPLSARDAFDAMRAIAWTGDAGVYVLDGDGALRRYLDVGDEACVLTPDGAFGTGGVLAFPDPPEGWAPRSMAVDGGGHLYVSAPLGGTYRLTGDHVDYHCETVGRVTVSPDGATGFGLFGTGPARRIQFGDTGCSQSEWVPLEVPSILESISFIDDARVLVGGQDGREGPHTARVYDLEGRPLEPAFGSEDASAADRLCYTHAAFPCAAGLCVLDGNCRTLFARGDGGVVGRADVAALTGLAAPWIVPPAGVDHDMTFIGAAQPVVEADGTRTFSASVFRLHGL